MEWKKLMAVALAASVCLGIGCTKVPDAKGESGSQSTVQNIGESVPNQSSENGSDLPDVVVGNYKWDPYVWGDSLTRAYGESMKETTFNLIKALINGEETFEYVNESDIWNIPLVSLIVCPYYDKIITGDILTKNGTATLTYKVSKDEAKVIIDDFAKSVESVLNVSIAEGDSDEVKALMVHYNFSKTLDYDLDALDDSNMDIDASPYRAMVERIGICQSFAFALAHLYLQCGVDSNAAMGSSPKYAHMWVYMKLNGEEFFIDPTWEDTHNGTGLSFFGIDTAFYNSEEYEVGPYLYLEDSSYTGNISSSKYKALWKMQKINSIERKDGKLVIDFVDASGNNATFEVDN